MSIQMPPYCKDCKGVHDPILMPCADYQRELRQDEIRQLQTTIERREIALSEAQLDLKSAEGRIESCMDALADALDQIDKLKKSL